MACEYYSDMGGRICYASIHKQFICRAGSFKDCIDRKFFEDGIDWKSPTLEEVTENIRTGRIWKK